MRRYMINTAALLSTILLVAIVAMWIDSHFHILCIGHDSATGDFSFYSWSGWLILNDWGRAPNSMGWHLSYETCHRPIDIVDYPGIVVHYSLVMSSLCIFPMIWLFYQLSQPPDHCCQHCGYDLRGSVGKESCPECGTPIADTASSPPAG